MARTSAVSTISRVPIATAAWRVCWSRRHNGRRRNPGAWHEQDVRGDPRRRHRSGNHGRHPARAGCAGLRPVLGVRRGGQRGVGTMRRIVAAGHARCHRVALKGPLTTPVGGGFSSLNVELRKRFDLYANVRPALTLPGTKARYENIDIITVRENTEGAYLSEGQTLSADGQTAQSIVRNTRHGAERIVRYAFELAEKRGRKKVTVVHKANIIKTASGLFLEVAREVAARHPAIAFNEMIVDNTCMQLVMNPWQFDVIVTTNLFGDILSDLCAGLVGGLGLAP